MQSLRRVGLWLLLVIGIQQVSGQKILQKVENQEVDLTVVGDYLNPYIPYLLKNYYRSYNAHANLWGYRPAKSYVMLSDLCDTSNGGANVTPFNFISLYVAPYSTQYSIEPNTERFRHLFNHEQTHIAMCDKASRRDSIWRTIFLGKVVADEHYPLSALYSYLTTPRWYSPRWYQEGIAIFMETWLNGGVGRSLGNYDEMYFRTLVHDKQKIYSVVGLDVEGTAIDFQVGANSYLYGTRFVNYLAYQYGVDKLLDFYNRRTGTHTLFSRQFHEVYHQSLEKVWNEWIAFEEQFQQNNLARIADYPLTDLKSLTGNLGSVSNVVYNRRRREFVMGVAHPGQVSYVCAVDASTGKKRKIAPVEDAMLYQVCYVAVDEEGDRLFATTGNQQFRGLAVYDLATGKKIIGKHLLRVADIVYNPQSKRLYGVRRHEGKVTLLYFNEDLSREVSLYSFKFGESISDLAVSHDGSHLLACLSSLDGEQSLIEFDLHRLDQGDLSYQTIFQEEGTTLNQFQYSLDDSSIIGTSYYTGVANVWQVERRSGNFELLSNVQTGLFAPVEYAPDSLFALSFGRDGMQPVLLERQVLPDANPVEFLGQRAFEKNPVLKEWTEMIRQEIASSDTLTFNTQATPYYPLRNYKLQNGYADIAGFKNTVVAGYRLNFSDPIYYSNLSLFLGVSPWSNEEEWKRIHISMQWRYGLWAVDAHLNRSDFYDLFGPTKVSRSGYSVGLTYEYNNALRKPYGWGWSANVTTYGLLDAMPLYQNVQVDVNSMQSATLKLYLQKLRRTQGATQDEAGYRFTTQATSYLVDGNLFAGLHAGFDKGFLLPLRNSSFWLRSGVGKTFGDRSSAFGNTYFGGFYNNYVDYRDSYQYRRIEAMPGIEIDEVEANHYGKLMAEVVLPPIRFSEAGVPHFYLKHAQLSLFSTALETNPFERGARTYINLGTQLNVETVLFTYLKTTFSVGYGRMIQGFSTDRSQWMFSLKLLGR